MTAGLIMHKLHFWLLIDRVSICAYYYYIENLVWKCHILKQHMRCACARARVYIYNI